MAGTVKSTVPGIRGKQRDAAEQFLDGEISLEELYQKDLGVRRDRVPDAASLRAVAGRETIVDQLGKPGPLGVPNGLWLGLAAAGAVFLG